MNKGHVNTNRRARRLRSPGAVWALAVCCAAGTADAAFHGWAVGTDSSDGPIILHTTNGHQWAVQTAYASSDPDIGSVDGVPGGVLWTVGAASGGYATIRRSADQGATWVRQGTSNSLPNAELLKIRAVNERVLWAVGTGGAVVMTTNGGVNWVNVSIPGVNQMLQGVDAVDGQRAWVGGVDDALGYAMLYRTINGGATWTRQSSGGITNVEHVLGIRAIDADRVWAVGGAYQNILQTTNGGTQWITRYSGASFRDANELAIAPDGGVWVATDSTIFWSTNQGVTWADQLVPDYTLDISTPDGENVWAVSHNYAGGYITRTDNGGVTWSNQRPSGVKGLHGVVVFDVQPMTRYVATNSPNPMPPYTNWSTAARTIQEAVDIALPGETVLVSNGVYEAVSITNRPAGTHIGSRVVVDKPITLRSVNGPEVTVIRGIPVRNEFAVRCAWVTNGASVSGFTFSQGGTDVVGSEADRYGAGVYAQGADAVFSNCVFDTCMAERGAGIYGGTVYDSEVTGNEGDVGGGAFASVLTRCVFSGNTASNSGGAAASSLLTGCTVQGNTASLGGGTRECELYNGLLIGNSALEDGGGVYLGDVFNSTLYGNTAGRAGAGAWGADLRNSIIVENELLDGTLANYVVSDVIQQIFSSCTRPMPAFGSQNITGDPRFTDAANTNFYPLPLSPCINAGVNAAWMSNAVDWAGQPRIYNSTVDMGALEWQGQVEQSTVRVTEELAFGTVTTGMTARLTMQIHNDGPDALQVLRVRCPEGFAGPWSGTIASGAVQDVTVEFTPLKAVAYGTGDLIQVDCYATAGEDTATCSGKGTVLQIPAAWLAEFGLPTNRTDKDVYVDFEDTDGDSFSNWEEWRAQTDPTNALSYFRFTQVETRGAQGVAVTWISATNRTYSLFRTTNLLSRLPYVTVVAHRPGQTNETEYVDSPPAAANGYFYRIEIDE